MTEKPVHLLLVVIDLAVCLACTDAGTPALAAPSRSPTPPASGVLSEGAPADFVFRVDDYNWEINGSELIVVHADGRVEHIFYEGPLERGVITTQWYRATTSLQKATLDRFRQLLVDVNSDALDAKHIDEQVDDGVMTTFTLTTGERTKSVYCANKFSDAIQRLQEFVRTNMVGAIPRSTDREALTHQKAFELGAVRWRDRSSDRPNQRHPLD